MKVVWITAISLIILSGCSSYQLSSKSTGSVVGEISPSTFKVNFCGNAYMTQKDVEKYALQRASEVALSKGYFHFIVVKKDDSSRLCAVNPGMKGASPYNQGTGADSKNTVSSAFVEPNISLTIQCYPGGEKLPEGAIDAGQFLRENFPGLGK